MPSSSTKRPVLAMATMALAFVAALSYMFHLMFQQGDVYPPYSSLRVDPMGTRAFYESLESMGVDVSRNYDSLSQFGKPRGLRKPSATAATMPNSQAGKTLILAGEPAMESIWPLGMFNKASARQMNDFLAGGGRMVICLTSGGYSPMHSARGRRESSQPAEKQPDKQNGKKHDKPASLPTASDDDDFDTSRDLPALGGVRLAWHEKSAGDSGRQTAMPQGEATDIDEGSGAAWYAGLSFETTDPAWKMLYTLRGRAVVIERPWHGGAILLASDSYFLSNEALAKKSDRCVGLLAHVIGPGRSIIFDETHLGVQRQEGVASLARKYHLEGVFVVLLALAGLVVWKSMASFGPRREQEQTDPAILGKGTQAALVNLLRRFVAKGGPSKRLIDVCVQEWTLQQEQRKSAGGSSPTIAAAGPLPAPGDAADVVGQYNEFYQRVRLNKPHRRNTPK